MCACGRQIRRCRTLRVGVFSSETGTGVTFNGSSAIIPICHSSCPASGEFKVYAENASLDLVVDVSGYFRSAGLVGRPGAELGHDRAQHDRHCYRAAAQRRHRAFGYRFAGDQRRRPRLRSLQPKITNGDKVEFGNEVDFVGQPLSGLTAVGFTVKTTNENNALAAANMPAILIEINPGDGHASYSTLNYSPTANTSAGAWTYVDAFADPSAAWGLTGGYYNSPATTANCGINGPRCTLAQVLALLPNATILSVGVGKGRDYAWHGEIDSLRFNGTTYDFEAQGVVSVPTP